MDYAKQGDTVKVHYLARTKNEVIFNSKNLEPLKLTIGNNEVIPAFEKAIIGMKLGDHKIINVAAKDAFGLYQKELISKVDRNLLPKDLELQVGQVLQIQEPDGNNVVVTLIAIDDKIATFDGNHPLAGKDLTFEIELLEILK